jgi:hypothetical protein
MDLTYSFVSIYTCVSSGSCQVFAISIGDMFTIRVSIAFGKTEVYNEDAIFGLFGATY